MEYSIGSIALLRMGYKMGIDEGVMEVLEAEFGLSFSKEGEKGTSVSSVEVYHEIEADLSYLPCCSESPKRASFNRDEKIYPGIRGEKGGEGFLYHKGDE